MSDMLETSCVRCGLSETRTQVVVGRGSLAADVLFLGEAPGRSEDQTGLGFQGAAGQQFNEILRFVGLERANIWLANAVRCRPSVEGRKNRPPAREEIRACRHWLVEDITRIQPRMVVTMGRVAFETMTGLSWDADLRAKPLFVSEFDLWIFPLYHPAYLIYKREWLPVYRADLERLRHELLALDIALDAPAGPWV